MHKVINLLLVDSWPATPLCFQFHSWHETNVRESKLTWLVDSTHLKNMSQNWIISPIFGVNIKNIWNHHLVACTSGAHGFMYIQVRRPDIKSQKHIMATGGFARGAGFQLSSVDPMWCVKIRDSHIHPETKWFIFLCLTNYETHPSKKIWGSRKWEPLAPITLSKICHQLSRMTSPKRLLPLKHQPYWW